VALYLLGIFLKQQEEVAAAGQVRGQFFAIPRQVQEVTVPWQETRLGIVQVAKAHRPRREFPLLLRFLKEEAHLPMPWVTHNFSVQGMDWVCFTLKDLHELPASVE
jgi:hypothetical protein